MFTLVTGTPGAGKTLYTITQLKEGVKFPNSENFRPIYYYGIPDISLDLGWHLLENPSLWHDEVPDGSIIVIDECQEHFPVRPAKNPVPAGLVAIERHRHRGLDLYFLTQHPSLLDHHARRLVGQHCHLKRNFGASFAVLYRSNECMGDVQDYHTLKKAEKVTFKYPKSSFGLYKSAEVHTHKFRMPKIIYFLFFLVFIVVLLVYKFYTGLMDKGTNEQSSTLIEQSNNLGVDLFNTESSSSLEISLDDFIPQIDNIPASSRFYVKDWAVKSVPIVSSCIGSSDRCACYTQQGTKVLVSNEFCLDVLENGALFDHTLEDNRTVNRDK